MSNIVTLTLSPCIDKSTAVHALIAEKKLHCTDPVMEPGGGGINVARAIAKLGGNTIAVYPAGGYTGLFFNELLQHENVPARPVKAVNSLRENFIVFEQSTSQQYRFGMPGAVLHDDEWNDCVKAIEAINDLSFLVVSGSLPPGVPTTIFSQLAAIAAHKNAKLIVDTSGQALKDASCENIYLLKPYG